MVPQYMDISHFRAPYKNVAVSGFGQGDLSPVINAGDMVEEDVRGYRFIKPEYQPVIDNLLAMHYPEPIVVEGALAIRIYRYSDDQIAQAAVDPAVRAQLEAGSVLSWVRGQKAAGQVVFIPMSTLGVLVSTGYTPVIGTPTPYPSGSAFLWVHPAASPQAREAARSPVAAILAGYPTFLAAVLGKKAPISPTEERPDLPLDVVKAELSPWGVGLLVIAIIGGTYLLTKDRSPVGMTGGL